MFIDVFVSLTSVKDGGLMIKRVKRLKEETNRIFYDYSYQMNVNNNVKIVLPKTEKQLISCLGI